MLLKLYPWQTIDYNYLLSLNQSPPPVTLLYGSNKIGIYDLALNWSMSLLCHHPQENGNFCGACTACVLFANDTHPDFMELINTDTDKSITVESVRNLIDFVSIATHSSQYKIILIANVNLLNINSANALLKILEETNRHTLFILISYNIQQILPTIISRCQKYYIRNPNKLISQEFVQKQQMINMEFWLRYNEYLPLMGVTFDEPLLKTWIDALSLPTIENIYQVLKNINNKSIDFEMLLEFFHKWINDVIMCKMLQRIQYFDECIHAITQLCKKLNLSKAFIFQENIVLLMPWSNHPLNYKIHIENLFFQYQQIFTAE